MSADHRLDVLDGMRGLAALAVVLYHYMARWAEPAHDRTLYPHGNLSELLPGLMDYGRFGVFLFFMISGFVIMMTLERCSGLADFTLRRALRLWPAMLVCATLSSLVVNRSGVGEYYGMELWSVDFLEYVSSIFFLPPDLTYKYLGMPVRGHWVEGVYWTLWCEVRFYALAAMAYFLSPRKFFLWLWLIVQCAATMMMVLDLPPWGKLFYPAMALQPVTLPWFTLGICGYQYWQGRMRLPVWLLIAAALASLLVHHGETWRALTLCLAVWGMFALFLIRSSLLVPLQWWPFLKLGMISYPLYLFHEMPGMAGFMVAERLGFAAFPSMLLMIFAVILVAALVHYFVENPTKRHLNKPLGNLSQNLERLFPVLRFHRLAGQ